jgi:formylglycine-generating enzyme required for sulfatase activity
VVRGGGWNFNSMLARASYRLYDRPGFRYDILGFRCLRPAP